ncbi:hypothetical protein FQA39_LY14052 [Lamprigera yunnana]|nr:hypothetical protein FQA39_LY14052 [Lamprigera yunnana]
MNSIKTNKFNVLMNKMNNFIVGVLVISLVNTAHSWEQVDQMCIEKLNLDKNVIEPLTRKFLHSEDNDDYNKYSECYWKEYKLLDDNNNIKWDALETLFTSILGKFYKKELVTYLKECKDQHLKGENIGQTIVKNQNCIIKGLKIEEFDSFRK